MSLRKKLGGIAEEKINALIDEHLSDAELERLLSEEGLVLMDKGLARLKGLLEKELSSTAARIVMPLIKKALDRDTINKKLIEVVLPELKHGRDWIKANIVDLLDKEDDIKDI